MRREKKSAASFIVYYNFLLPRERERSQEGMLLNEFTFLRKTSDEGLSPSTNASFLFFPPYSADVLKHMSRTGVNLDVKRF